MRRFILLFPLCALLSCTSFDPATIENLNAGKVLKIGHGGLGFPSILPFNPYPANSFKSLRKAIEEYNADGIEVDVHMTKDKKFVLYHDRELDSETELQGCIESKNYNEVVGLDYKVGFPYDIFQSEQLIGLDSLLDYLNGLEEFPHLHLDTRIYGACLSPEENGNREGDYIRSLIKLLVAKNVPPDRVLINTMTRSELIVREAKSSPFHLVLEEVADFDRGLEYVKYFGLNYLMVKPEILTAANSKKAQKKGVQIITFGGKNIWGNVELLKLNPDVLQTNDLGSLNNILE